MGRRYEGDPNDLMFIAAGLVILLCLVLMAAVIYT